MSVSRKVLKNMKKVMGVIGAIPVLTSCSSQISRAYGEVRATFDYFTGTLRFSGNGVIDKSWQECYNKNSVRRVVIVNGIKKIGTDAFCACRSLIEITIPNSVNIIDKFAFAASGLERVKFEDMSRCDSKSCWDVVLRETAFGGCKQLGILDLGNDTNMSRIAKVERYAFWRCDPNFVALEGSTVRGKFYNTVLNYHYNYFIPNAFLFDSINDRINKKNSFFKKG